MAQGLTTPIDTSRGQVGVWLLDIDTGGAVLRFATAPGVTVEDREGRTRVYRAGLQPLEVNIDPRLDAQAIEVVSSDVDWAADAARRKNPSRWIAELRHWYPGQKLEEARYVLKGRMKLPEYADPSNPDRMAATISATYLENRNLHPGETELIDANTWTDDRTTFTQVIETQSKGVSYPLPLGYPGSGDDAIAGEAAMPVPVAALDGTLATQRIILALGAVDAAQVRIWGGEDYDSVNTWLRESEVVPVATEDDALGQEVSYADMSSATGNWGFEEGKTYWVGYKNDTGHGGGKTFEGSLLRGLGDIIHWALVQSGADLDLDMVISEKTALNRYKLDTYLNTRLDLVEWIDTVVAKLFPIRRIRTGRGIYYKYIDWHPSVKHAAAVYDVARGDLRPASPIRWLEPVRNKLTIEYKYLDLAAHHYGRTIFDGVAAGLGDKVLVPIAKASQTMFGVIEGATITTNLTWSESTVSRLARDILARDAMPLALRTYTAPKLSRHVPGDVILLKNELDISTQDQLAIVERVRIGRDLERIDCTILHPALRQVS